MPLQAMLAGMVAERCGGNLSESVKLAKQLHVVPEFLGNRAPLAHPHARAVIVGLGMESDMGSLLALYVAGMCGIAYGLRQIIEAQMMQGTDIERIMISGGAGRRIWCGSCWRMRLGSRCSRMMRIKRCCWGQSWAVWRRGAYGNVEAAMAGMSRVGRRFDPQAGALTALHQESFGAFESLQSLARRIRQI